jgi:DHA3 family macrolide efflux protein-like MFS transporter
VLTLLSQRNFCLLWVAHTISILGDYVFFIAITFWIYEQTGSAFATGAVLITSTVPSFLFAPLAGMLVDCWNRKNIMFIAESARAVLFLGLLGIVIVQSHTLWPIYVVGFIQSAMATFFWPARSALLPQLIEPSSLFASNALYMLSDSGVRVIAPSLSAFVLLRFGPPSVIAIDTASFVVSAGCVCFLATDFLPPLKAVSSLRKRNFSAISAEAQENSSVRKIGILMKRARWIQTPISYRIGGLFALASIVAYIAGTLSILFPVFARTLFSAGPVAYGWMLTAQALGEGVISLFLGQTQRQRGRARVIFFLSGYLAVGGIALMLMARLPLLAPSLLLNLIFGAMTAATTIQLLTFLQQYTANHLLGRMLATYTAVQALAQIVGMGVASIAVSPIGVTWFLIFNGVLYLLGSSFTWILATGYSS